MVPDRSLGYAPYLLPTAPDADRNVVHGGFLASANSSDSGDDNVASYADDIFQSTTFDIDDWISDFPSTNGVTDLFAADNGSAVDFDIGIEGVNVEN